MKKDKILCLLHMPPPLHGVSYINTLLTENYNNEKIELDVIEISYSNKISDLGNFSYKKIVIYFKILMKYIYKLVIARPKAVYFSITPCGNGFIRDSVFVLVAKIFKIKVILHLHGIGIDNELNNKWKFRLYKVVFRNVNVIVLSKSILFDIDKIKNLIRKIYIVNNGIPITSSEYLNRQKETRTDSIFVITNLSTIRPLKGQLTLIKAINVLKNRGIKVKCKIAGQVSNEEYFEKLKVFVNDEELDSYVDFIGPIWNEEKTKLLSGSDIFVFPTSWESFGLVVLEAFNFKLPVIASTVGSLPEIIDEGHNGFLVNVDDYEMIANRIEDLVLNPSKLIEMGNNGHNKLCRLYSLDSFITKTNEVFMDVIYNFRQK